MSTEWMAGVVSSLADNKAALGRRYGEWAVSALPLWSPRSPPRRWRRTSSGMRARRTRC